MNNKSKTDRKRKNYRIKKTQKIEITREDIEEAMKRFTGKIQRLKDKDEPAPINPVNIPRRLF